MKDRGIHVVMRSFLISGLICSAFLYSGCAPKSEEPKMPPEYADRIDIKVTLGTSSGLTDMSKADIFYTVTNNGDKTITYLSGDLVFYDASGIEVGRTGLLFFHANEALERRAEVGKKARSRALPPGQTMNSNYDVSWVLGGESEEIRDEIYTNWDNLTASAIIKIANTE